MAPPWIASFELAAAIALLVVGAVMAWSAANAPKRTAGVQIAMLGACIGLAALGAPGTFMLVAIAISIAHLALGLSIVVRLQESYGAVEAPEIDAADMRPESPEREP